MAEILGTLPDSLTSEEIELTREQFKAGIVLSNESMSAIASSAGRQLLLNGRYIDLDETLKEISSVTLDEVKEAARLVTDPKTLALAAVGETHDEQFYREMLTKLAR